MSALHASLHHPTQRSWDEPHIHPSQLVYPLFVSDKSEDIKVPGFSPNVQWGNKDSYASLVSHLTPLVSKGLSCVMLFGVVTHKAHDGPHADHTDTPVIKVLQVLTNAFPSLLLGADVCLCEYTDHGHCGLLRRDEVTGESIIANEETISRLADVSVSYARAGAHIVAPSDMMDNRVGKIRSALDAASFQHVSIMAYTSKKASCMYAPFRDAVDSTFVGDRKRYQHPIGSKTHASRAYSRDILEGADSVIVKPSLFYGDIVKSFADKMQAPVVCYVVSGEYKMLMDYGMATNSLQDVVRESHVSLLRAGANVLITYFTPFILENLKDW